MHDRRVALWDPEAPLVYSRGSPFGGVVLAAADMEVRTGPPRARRVRREVPQRPDPDPPANPRVSAGYRHTRCPTRSGRCAAPVRAMRRRPGASAVSVTRGPTGLDDTPDPAESTDGPH